MKIALFVPCFVDQLMPQMGLDTAAVLKRSGYEVEFRKEQTCCGQPAFNSGYWNDARPLAERFVRVFKSAEMVVCPSGSCTTMVRIFYPEHLRATPTKPFPNPESLWSETRRRSRASSISTCDKTFRCGASSACSNPHENCQTRPPTSCRKIRANPAVRPPRKDFPLPLQFARSTAAFHLGKCICQSRGPRNSWIYASRSCLGKIARPVLSSAEQSSYIAGNSCSPRAQTFPATQY